MSDETQKASPDVSDQIHDAFNFEDADVTLKSSDGVRFRVHKARLATVSVMFRDMFENGTDDAGVVSVGETAATLGVLLPMCYPASSDTPPVDLERLDHSQLMQCFEASCKYDMWVATQLLRRLLVPLVDKDPFSLVRVAFVVQDKDLLAKAAEATLALDILAPGDQLQEKAGTAWPALLQYHMRVKREINHFMRFNLSCTPGGPYNRKRPCLGNPNDCEDPRNGNPTHVQLMRTRRDNEWEIFRWSLASNPTVQLPKGLLVQFLDRKLDDNSVRACSGCRSTWEALKQEVNAFQIKTVFNL